MTPPDSLEERARTAFRDLVAELPTELEIRTEALAGIRRVLHEEIAKSLEPALNGAISQRKATNLSERKRLAAWIDRVTRQVGVAVELPGSDMTGRPPKPALIIAEPIRPGDHGGRFTFIAKFRNEVGGLGTCGDLEPLRLVPAPLDFEANVHKYRVNNTQGHRPRWYR